MRRSKAPSVVKKTKRMCIAAEEVGHCSDPEDEQYAWGSRSVKKKQIECENKKIFNVVWRDVSMKKHKTWKGDGTLEVCYDSLKAVLKDEAGKYIACSSKFNRNELIPDYIMVIGSKEIEIQNEVVGEDQLHEVRKRQIENSMNEFKSYEVKEKEERKPKGGFLFQPILVLTSPNQPSDKQKNIPGNHIYTNNNYRNEIQNSTHNLQANISKINSNVSSNSAIAKVQTHLNSGHCKEYIIFLRPSELQQFLFQKVLEYISSNKSSSMENIQWLALADILQDICNHPSMINHKDDTNELVRYLHPVLPNWSEMGPFDSCKLEFVQYFVTNLKKHGAYDVCTILAKNETVVNMLQGLCDFMNIKCLRMETNTEAKVVHFCLRDCDSFRVLLVNTEKMSKNYKLLTYSKNIIIYNDVSNNLNISCVLESTKDIIVYNLVTSFSIEELFLLNTYNNKNMDKFLSELHNITTGENESCYLHSKIGCNCFKSTCGNKYQNHIFNRDWDHFNNPFDLELLKISSLENSSENIVSIFCKRRII